MPREKIIISRHIDRDFGALELIETRFEASVNGRPKTPFVSRHWTGKQAELDVEVIILSNQDPPIIQDGVRTDFQDVMSDLESFKQRIARSQLQLARNWIAGAGMDLTLDEMEFASLLRI